MRLGALGLAVAALVTASSLQGAREWRKVATPQFTIFTHASDGTTRDVVDDFEDLQFVLDRLTPVRAADRKPLTIVIFADDDEFTPFKLQINGKTVDDIEQERFTRTGSLSASGHEWMVIAAGAQDYSEATQRVIRGGGVYWYLESLDYPIPPAVRTGLVELMSNYHRQINHAEVGALIPQFVTVIDQWSLIPVEKLLAEENPHKAMAEHELVTFRAESWALVHYLLFARESTQRHAFNLFWRALGEGASPHEALVRALGPEVAAQINWRLRAYIGGILYVLKLPIPEEVEHHAPLVPADVAELEMALTKAALAGRRDAALGHADAAVAAAGDRAEPYEMRAEVLERLRAADGVQREAVERAVARGSHAPWIVGRTAEYRLQDAGGAKAAPAEARAVVNLAERAINDDRRLRPAIDLLCRALCLADHVTGADGQFLAYARKRFPEDRWVLVGQAAILRHRGDVAGARELEARALSDSGGLYKIQLPDVRAFLATRPRG